MLKSISKKTYILISVFILLMCVIVYSIRASFAAGDVYTKEELQDIVVGTGLSYLYNHEYTEYDSGFMDITPTGTKSGKTTTLENTFYWSSYEESPEDINRGSYYVSFCSSFTSNVNMKSIGFDAENYYSNGSSTYSSNKYYFTGANYKNVINSVENYKKGIKYLGKGGTILDRLALNEAAQYTTSKTGCDGKYDHTTGQIVGRPFYDDCSTNETPFVFYYKVQGTETEEQKKEILDILKKVLKKGDVLSYRFNEEGHTSEIGNTGHALMYVGDSISSDTGLIHSTGWYFEYNEDGTLKVSGDDKFAVRYNSMEQYYDKLFWNTDTKKSVFIAVYRPVNTYCNGTDDKCTITLTDTQKARAEFSKLRIEQYTSENKNYNDNLTTESVTKKSLNKTLSKYTSVNHGDTITYNLYLKNMSNYEYCAKDGDTPDTCTSYGSTWNTGDKAKTYNNLVVSGEIPTNTTYIDYQMVCKKNNNQVECNDQCTVNNGKINCPINTIGPNDELTISYNVKVNDSAPESITNNGMTVSTSNNTLSLSQIKTKINPTLNGINKDLLDKKIAKINNYAQDGIIEYSENDTTDYKKSIDDLSSDNKATLSSSGFPKMLYYNEFGIDLSYLTGSNIINAIFNKRTSVGVNDGSTTTNYTVSNFYSRKTTDQTNEITNTNYKNINAMLVQGMYGGRRLYGNARNDRPRYLKYTDLEVGDIVVTFNNNASTTTWYIYQGLNANGEANLQYLNTNGLIWRWYMYADTKDEYIAYPKVLYTADLFAVFRPMQLYGTTVKYNYNGATEIGDNSYVANGTYRNLNAPKKSPYIVQYNYGASISGAKSSDSASNTFDGWYSDSNFSNKVTNTTTLTSQNTHTIYAKWNTDAVSLPQPTRDGYHFTGWYENDTTKIENMNNYVPSKNITLTAHWTELPEVGINISRVDGGIDVSIISINGKADGYEIYKYDNINDNYVLFDDIQRNQLFISNDFSENNNVKVYAKPYIVDGNQKIYGKSSNISVINEEISRITVNYISDTNGIVTGDVTQVLNVGESPVATLVSPNTGYKFSHWTVDKNVTLVDGTNIAAGEPLTTNQVNSISVNESIIIKANFTAITYNVTYKSDENATITGKTTEEVLYNHFPTGTTIKANDGYIFSYWTSDKSIKVGNKTIEAGSKITSQEITNAVLNGDTVFTANINKLKYVIYYTSDSHGSITGKTSEEIEYNGNPTGTTITSDNGYSFYRWQVNNNVELTNGTIISSGNYITSEQLKLIKVKQNIDVLGVHTKINYTVSYTSNSLGTIKGSTEETIAYYDHPTGATTEPNEGYMFDCWTSDKDITIINDNNIIGEGNQDELTEVEKITIKAGEPISQEQLAKAVIEDSIVLTANYKELSYKIVLNNQNSTKSGTTFIYEIYDKGLYLDDKDENSNLNNNSITIPEKTVRVDYQYSYGNYEKLVNMTFDGYYSEKNGQGEKLIDSSGHITNKFTSTLFESNSTIYANWIGVSINLYKPIVEGYTFMGWYSNPELETKVGNANDVYEVNKNITLYGNWQNLSYQISYDANGGEGQMENSIHQTGVLKALSNNLFKRTGYHFMGWSTNQNDTVPTYRNNQKVVNLANEENAVIKLYAIWEENDNKLYVDVDVLNGDVDSSIKSVNAGNTATFILTADEGYHNPTVTCTNEQNGNINENRLTIDNITENTVCTVAFIPISYQIRYNANGGQGTMENSTYKYDESKQLTKNSFMRNGYKFVGWSEEADSKVTLYKDEAYVNKLTYENDEVIDLFASWKIIDYLIKYNLMGGEADNPSLYDITTETFTLNNPTKEGYTFIGWTTEDEETPNREMSIVKSTTGDKIYTAHWEANNYTISFESNGGTQVDSITKKYGEQVANPIAPTKENRRFAGWYSDSELTKLYSFTTMPSKDLTLYAKWADKEYLINYELDGGINNEHNPSVYEYGDNVILAPPTKIGYRFIGWYKDIDYVNEISSIDTEDESDITLYAKWEIEKYKVSFKDNSQLKKEIELNYGDEIPNLSIPTKKGYRFTGWYQDSNHTTIFSDKTMPASDVVLYAGWEANKYRIKFESNGGSKLAYIEDDYNASVSEPTKPTKEGYTFAGWYSDKKLTKLYKFDTMPANNLTLYAKWIPNNKGVIIEVPNTSNNKSYISIIAGLSLIIGSGYLIYKKIINKNS